MVSSQSAYQRTLLTARQELLRDLDLQTLLVSVSVISNQKKSRLKRERQRKQLGKLAALGVIDLHLDDTYNLSNVGKVLVKELQQK